MSVRSRTSATWSDAIDHVLTRGAAGSVSVLVDQIERRNTREEALSPVTGKLDGNFLVAVPRHDSGDRALAELRMEDALADSVGRRDRIDARRGGDGR